jgi:hypothetical protein
MQGRHDDFKDSFYYRAIRTKIGAALRAQYDLTEPLPDRLAELLGELEQREDGKAVAPEKKS